MKHNYGSRGAADRCEEHRIKRGEDMPLYQLFKLSHTDKRTGELTNDIGVQQINTKYHLEVERQSQLHPATRAVEGWRLDAVYRGSEQQTLYICPRPPTWPDPLPPLGMSWSRDSTRRSGH